MDAHNLIKEQRRDVGGIQRLGTRYEVSHFRKMVHYDKDRVVPLRSTWESKNEVHAHILPRTNGDRQGRIQSCILFPLLGQGTCATLLDQVSNVSIDGRPKEGILNSCDSLVSPKMA